MTRHALIKYLKFIWKAKSRHGVHSPFVYDFTERVLLDREIIPRAFIVSCPRLPLRFENILSRTAAHYKCNTVLILPAPRELNETSKIDMLVLPEDEPEQWLHLFYKYNSLMSDRGVVAALSIHKTRDHSLAWKNLCNEPDMKLSVDLFGIGLLFFRDEFKERQHFVLKY